MEVIMPVDDLRFIGKLKHKLIATEYSHQESDKLEPLLDYLTDHKSGVLIAESGRGRSYASQCICAELDEKGYLGLVIPLADYVSIDISALINPNKLLELQQANQAPIIILDGYEHLLNKGGSLRSILNALLSHFPELGVSFLVTCLPIDFALNNPTETLVESEDNDENVVFTAELQSMDADEIESYIEFEKGRLRSISRWNNEQANAHDGLLPWIEEQGLIDHCRKPNDLAWLLELKSQHQNQTDKFITLGQVIDRQIRFELSYAKKVYGDNSFELAYKNIELLAVTSRLTSQPVHQIIFDYPFTLNGKGLLNIARSGLIHSYTQGWGQREWTFSPLISDWLISSFLQRKLKQGMSVSSLTDYLFIKLGQSENTSLRSEIMGGAIFLVAQPNLKSLFQSILQKWPEVLIGLGDPSQLSSDDRVLILNNIQEKSRNGDLRLSHSSVGNSRFINQKVCVHISSSLETIIENDSAFEQDQIYLILLCSLIRYGEVNACSQPLMTILENCEITNEFLWEEIVSTIAKVGNQAQRERLIAQVPQLNGEPAKEQIEHYANKLFHVNKHLILNEISLEQFILYLHPLIDVQTNESISGFKTYIPYTLWEKLGTEELKRELINGLYQLLREDDGTINIRYRWIIDPLGDVLKNFLSEVIITTNDAVWQIIIDLVAWKDSLSGNTSSEQFTYEVTNSSKICLDMALSDIFKYRFMVCLWARYQFRRYQNNERLWFYHLLQSLDRNIDHSQLAKDILLDNDESDEFRLFALRGTNLQELLSLAEDDIPSEQIRVAIQERINAVLSSQESTSEQTDEPNPEHQQRVLERQQSEQQFTQHIEESIDSIRSGEYLGAIQRLANMGGGGRFDFGFFPSSEITERFGEDVANAVKDGVIHLLNYCALPCKSLSTNDIDGVHAALILQAITLESQSIQQFSGQRLRNAIAAITWELNRPPIWVDRLIRHHKEIARNILEPVIQAETQAPEEGENPRSLHSFAKNSNGHLAFLCWEIIQYQLENGNYQWIETVLDATHLAIRYNNTDSACTNISTLATANREHYELQAYWLAIDPANGLNYLERLVENNSESNRTAVVQILATLVRGGNENLLLKRIWLEIDNLHRLLGVLLCTLPPNHDDMPEGVYSVTSEHQISHLLQILVSSLTERLNYEQGQQLVARLSNDERFNDFGWVDHIEERIFYKETSSPFSRQEVTQWVEGDWLQSIRTAGQLHDYIVGLLKDIKNHLKNDDFSSTPLWQGLCRYKDKTNESDRTEEEYVQVWLANEIQRRSKGNLTVERENQTNRSKRRDISVSIPKVGRCVIEIKVVNRSRSYGSYRTLVDTINTQIPMYVEDYNYNAAILFLFQSDDKKYNLPTRGNAKALPELVDELTDALDDLKIGNEQLRSLEALSVFGISVAPRPLPKTKET